MKIVIFESKMFDFTASLEMELGRQNAHNCDHFRASLLWPNILQQHSKISQCGHSNDQCGLT